MDKSQGLLKFTSSRSRLEDNFGNFDSQREGEIETKLDTALGTIQRFLDSACKEIA